MLRYCVFYIFCAYLFCIQYLIHNINETNSVMYLHIYLHLFTNYINSVLAKIPISIYNYMWFVTPTIIEMITLK